MSRVIIGIVEEHIFSRYERNEGDQFGGEMHGVVLSITAAEDPVMGVAAVLIALLSNEWVTFWGNMEDGGTN